MKKTSIIATFCLLLTACGKQNEIRGSEEKRIEAVQAMLQRHWTTVYKERTKGGRTLVQGVPQDSDTPLPSKIMVPHFLEEQIGGGRIGPSDFRSYCAFKVPKEEVDQWTSVFQDLEPPNKTPSYAAPKKTPTWWVSSASFSGLTFYNPRTLSGRINGWIGVDHTSGEIFVYSFTM